MVTKLNNEADGEMDQNKETELNDVQGKTDLSKADAENTNLNDEVAEKPTNITDNDTTGNCVTIQYYYAMRYLDILFRIDGV